MTIRTALLMAATLMAFAPAAQAREYPIGGPVHINDMEIVANYLVGIEMAPMPKDMSKDMATGDDLIHLETDVHATADNTHGFPDGWWVPYLTIDYTLVKTGSNWATNGHLDPMTARDGPHYAGQVKMDGPGEYTVTFHYQSPETNGFLHHTDKETGVPGWWKPFDESFTFKYPQK